MTTTDDPGINTATLIWDGEGRPLSSAFNDVYFSQANGLEETRFVFLQHNQLQQRWATLLPGETFTIGETGFGTGLNFLATWQLWRQLAPADTRLDFVSVERYPLTRADLQQALALWPELSELAAELIHQYPPALSPGFHRLSFDQGRVSLTLILADACDGYGQLLQSSHPLFSTPAFRINAWFLDGFAPAKNPEMWSDSLFTLIGQLSDQGTTAATFTCAGIVKNGLRSVGFEIEKVPGFGRKREMLKAIFTSPKQQPQHSDFTDSHHNSPYPSPWWATATATNPTHSDSRRAVVIGGGLAGCHSAYALAQRGWHVTLVEAHAALAQEGSGNPQGVLYAKLSHRAESLGDFNLACLMYAQRFYDTFWPSCGEQCGVLQFAQGSHGEEQQQQLLQRLGTQSLATWLTQAEMSKEAGLTTASGGLYFPHSGWLNPANVCAKLTQHPNIQMITQQKIRALTYKNSLWELESESGEQVMCSPVVIIAAANHSRLLTQTAHLPLKPVRGQVSLISANQHTRQLQRVICGEGYIAPAHEDFHCVGASFGPNQAETDIRQQEHQENLERLQALLPDLPMDWQATALTGRAALRATTPDYLPMVGPVASPTGVSERFAVLAKNAKAGVHTSVPTLPGLYVNVGHGSRGLCYTPLCAEILASQICSSLPPCGWEVTRSLHPARFLIRDIIRKR